MELSETVAARRQIPALEGMTYLDNAGAGLPPLSVTKAMNEFVQDWSAHGEHWEKWLLDVVELRRLYGQLIGANEKEVGVVPSVSVGLAGIASCLDLNRRKKVVTSELNFPTNVVLWQRMKEKGLLKTVKVLRQERGMIPLQKWEDAIDDDTAAVAVDYVSWFSGYREKIREISEKAHSHGATLIVDGFHAVGVLPFDVKREQIDVLVGGFYKWLCGPHGAACVYVDERMLDRLEPAYIGWHGIEDNVVERLQQGRDVFDVAFPLDSAHPAKSAARFEWGTWASVVVKGAIEAVRFAMVNDPASRFSSITTLRRKVEAGLRELGLSILTPSDDANDGSGIVTFATKDHKELVKRLQAKGIVVSGRFNHVRVSPHFYNTVTEAEALMEALKGSES